MRLGFREPLAIWLWCRMGAMASTATASAPRSRTLATFRRAGSSSAFPSPHQRDGSVRLVAAHRREFWAEWARGGAPNYLVRTVPAAIRRHPATAEVLNKMDSDRQIRHVTAVKTRIAELQSATQSLTAKLPPIPKPPKEDTGFYYGFTANIIAASTTDRPKAKPKPPKLKEAVALTLEEIRTMRTEMEALRKELQSLKQELGASGDGTVLGKGADSVEALTKLSKRELEKFYGDMQKGLETWALQMLKEDVKDGWTEINCNKAMRKTINPHGTTRALMKWMKDARGVGQVNPKDDRDYPCLKCTGVIDAPIEVVCLYLSQEQNMPEYNDLVEKYEDLQEITPSSKICLGQTPQILFIKPRSLVTFCTHRWLTDGSQLMLNQACRHPSRLNKNNIGVFEKSDELDDKKEPMAFALRGANLIARDPDDPENKTCVTILAHGNPGRDVPAWATKTAVAALGNLEPFRLFHNINKGIQNKMPQLQEQLGQQAQLVSERPDGRTSRPAGMAQIGYACFWPNGGGVSETPPAPDTNSAPDDGNLDENQDSSLETPSESRLSDERVVKEELTATVGS